MLGVRSFVFVAGDQVSFTVQDRTSPTLVSAVCKSAIFFMVFLGSTKNGHTHTPSSNGNIRHTWC